MNGEFAAVSAIRSKLSEPPRGETWIGDDAAVVASPSAPWQLLCSDTVVAGVHADLTLTTLADLGWKAVVVNVSDIAAMGGEPGYAMVAVAGPPSTDLGQLYDGIAAAAECYRCPVVGGDLSGAAVLVVTVAMTGSVDGSAVLRSGARPGDSIWVTGPLGASAAGLRLWRAGQLTPESADLRHAHARPRAAVAEGRAARRAGASAMIDVSDGFAADLGHVADASGVGFVLDELPIAAGATTAEALGGGEDYVLVFCAQDDQRVREHFDGLAPPYRVGRCVSDPEQRLLGGRPLAPTGWEHGWE